MTLTTKDELASKSFVILRVLRGFNVLIVQASD